MAEAHGGLPRYRMWWLKDADHVPPLLPGTGDVDDPTVVSDIYVSDFSSRALPGQELDVLAPGSWVRGRFQATRASTICRGGPMARAIWSAVTPATSSTSAVRPWRRLTPRQWRR